VAFIERPIKLEAALRCFTILLSPTQTCFHPAQISTPKEAYNVCCHYRHKALLKHIAIASCQVLIFYRWVNQSPHAGIAAHGASNPRLFSYESYVLTALSYMGISNPVFDVTQIYSHIKVICHSSTTTEGSKVSFITETQNSSSLVCVCVCVCVSVCVHTPVEWLKFTIHSCDERTS